MKGIEDIQKKKHKNQTRKKRTFSSGTLTSSKWTSAVFEHLIPILFSGQYSQWTYADNEKSSDYYCEYTPFMFAFVILILDWVLIPLSAILACTCLCGLFACAALSD